MRITRTLLAAVAFVLPATLAAPIPAHAATEVHYTFDGYDAQGFHLLVTMSVGSDGGVHWFGKGGAGRTEGCQSLATQEGFECGVGYISDMHAPPVTNCSGGTRIPWGTWAGDNDRRYNIGSTTAITQLDQIGSIAIHKVMPDGTTPFVACGVQTG